jgi:hypothetical protein
VRQPRGHKIQNTGAGWNKLSVEICYGIHGGIINVGHYSGLLVKHIVTFAIRPLKPKTGQTEVGFLGIFLCHRALNWF